MRLYKFWVSTGLATLVLVFSGVVQSQTPERLNTPKPEYQRLKRMEVHGPVVQASATQIGMAPPISLDHSGPFANGAPTQEFHRSVAAIALARQKVKTAATVRIDAQMLSVETDLRKALYEKIGSENINTSIFKIPQTLKADLDPESRASARETVTRSPGAISVAVLDEQIRREFLTRMQGSQHSRAIASPQLVTGDRQVAIFSRINQRPYVVDVKRVAAEQNAPWESDIQVLDEGTELGVYPVIKPESVELKSFVKLSKVVGVDTKRVFGVLDEEVVVQVPTFESTLLQAYGELKKNEVMLIDPYVELSAGKNKDAVSADLSKVPYVSKLFVEPSKPEPTAHLMILLRANIIEPVGETVAKNPR